MLNFIMGIGIALLAKITVAPPAPSTDADYDNNYWWW